MKPSILTIAALGLLLAGCETAERRNLLGSSVRVTLATQVINPTPVAPDPDTGHDGKAAKSGFDAYQKSYSAPVPQPNQLTIGVGGNSGG